MPNSAGEMAVGEMRDKARNAARAAGYPALYIAVCEAGDTDLMDDPAYWPDSQPELAKAVREWAGAAKETLKERRETVSASIA